MLLLISAATMTVSERVACGIALNLDFAPFNSTPAFVFCTRLD